MLYGSEEEKRKQSFGLLDKRGNGMITFEDFQSIVQSFAVVSARAPKWPPIADTTASDVTGSTDHRRRTITQPLPPEQNPSAMQNLKGALRKRARSVQL